MLQLASRPCIQSDAKPIQRIAIFSNTNFSRVKYYENLSLPRTSVTDAGIKHLSPLTNLATLSLDGTKVTDAGLQHLTQLSKLESLFLDNTQITDVGIEKLAALPNLEHLSLRGTAVTDSGVTDLKLALPALKVQR
jgi:Leucine-rich repeat (LRR) protein